MKKLLIFIIFAMFFIACDDSKDKNIFEFGNIPPIQGDPIYIPCKDSSMELVCDEYTEKCIWKKVCHDYD